MTYTHVPTRCDRKLILSQSNKPLAITDDAIAKSVAWYERSWVAINESLPLSIEGTTYLPKWQDIFDKQTLPQWRAGHLSKAQSVAYVYLALRNLFKGLGEVTHANS